MDLDLPSFALGLVVGVVAPAAGFAALALLIEATERALDWMRRRWR